MSKQWGGRFSGKTSKDFEQFSESISFDKRLAEEDIQVNLAHCVGLKKIGVLSQGEFSKIKIALQKILNLFKKNKVNINYQLEDIHTHVENELVKLVGDLGKKVHTGKSRNDQVATDVKLYLKKEINNQIKQIKKLQKLFVDLAKKNLKVIIPGYTHLQKAQPIYLSHYFLAYFEKLNRDVARFQFAFNQCDEMPLGSGALAGSSYKLPREEIAKLLGFTKITQNSLDGVSNRDFICDYLYAVAMLFIHLSQISEDFIIWNSYEFKFIELDDAFATGSSLMPQKKNPDVLELTRGKTSQAISHLMGIFSLLKALPMAYNRDLQEDKTFLFQSVDLIELTLKVFTQMVSKIKFDEKKMQIEASLGYLNATDLADYLVSIKIPFRKAHHITGKIVVMALKKKKELHQLTLQDFRKHSPKITKDVFKHLTLSYGLQSKDLTGGSSLTQIQKQISRAYAMLNIK